MIIVFNHVNSPRVQSIKGRLFYAGWWMRCFLVFLIKYGAKSKCYFFFEQDNLTEKIINHELSIDVYVDPMPTSNQVD